MSCSFSSSYLFKLLYLNSSSSCILFINSVSLFYCTLKDYCSRTSLLNPPLVDLNPLIGDATVCLILECEPSKSSGTTFIIDSLNVRQFISITSVTYLLLFFVFAFSSNWLICLSKNCWNCPKFYIVQLIVSTLSRFPNSLSSRLFRSLFFMRRSYSYILKGKIKTLRLVSN